MSLSSKSKGILSLIADGLSYDQIVDGHPEFTYLDIFNAASEAIENDEKRPSYHTRMAAIKEKNPNAYEKWTDDEENRLRELFGLGKSDREIGKILGRQPSAIASRKQKLNLS